MAEGNNQYNLGVVNGDGSQRNKITYELPRGVELPTFVKMINSYPDEDSPEVFKLHPNADITCRVKETNEMILTITETRPKEGGTGGESREDQVKAKVLSFQPKIKKYSYPNKMINMKLKKLKGPPGYPSEGANSGDTVPLNIFLKQELQRMENILNIVKKTFQEILQAIEGQIIMTPTIVNAIDSIYDLQIPEIWLYDSAKAEISWHKPTLAIWFESMENRNKMLTEWLEGARPKAFNLDLFFNPQGLLTSMTQEVVRINKNSKGSKKSNEAWSMDTIQMKFSFDNKKGNRDVGRKSHQQGIYIEGLWVEGANVDNQGNLKEIDSNTKKMRFPMPLVHATAENRPAGKKSEESRDSMYECPVYKYPRRTDFYLIIKIPLKSSNSASVNSDIWRLRGVAILCANDK